MSTAAATEYRNCAIRHPVCYANKRRKAQKSSDFWASGTYRLYIKDRNLIDPATGTGTFLRQTILQIFHNFCDARKDLTKERIQEEWNSYVPNHLLPRLNGFELMMAPYAVAHMKLAMVLKDTCYQFESNKRLQVYLTNALEKPGHSEDQLTLFDDPLAFEAVSANGVKKNTGINIVIGDPPYSNSSVNRNEWILNLISLYLLTIKKEKTIALSYR